MLRLNYRDSRPIYQQIKDGLRKLIVSGAYQPDEKLPSVRELAAELAINPNTIARAYRELEAEGVIYTITGRGAFCGDWKAAARDRISVLEDQVRPLLRELRTLGMTREELLALWEEEQYA